MADTVVHSGSWSGPQVEFISVIRARWRPRNVECERMRSLSSINSGALPADVRPQERQNSLLLRKAHGYSTGHSTHLGPVFSALDGDPAVDALRPCRRSRVLSTARTPPIPIGCAMFRDFLRVRYTPSLNSLIILNYY